ncbi:MAG: FliM/FliN family flagellar motor switch protein [Enterobacterales bacterium endosymbiont of Blomia tropicalis]|uniref:FliM/FliN family flagellar motor switch protein n=1 Tax=Mixta mediterraneensis TaxID=2758443 RepID=UPI00187480EA|nr:FliM/FliN family flagellar motor switch protein [Mixta mediterraneensis]MBE5251914.1 FliM/FliN family flagellar motor switch protein [Mixta mediterraneensis]MDL4914955.1 FliM/FliN family flagellar motor switch protein [Mixta mediterraneensis]
MQSLQLPVRNARKQAIIQYGGLTDTPVIFKQPDPTQRYIRLTATVDERVVTFYCTKMALFDASQLSAAIFPRDLVDEGLLAELAVGYFTLHNHAGPFFTAALKHIQCTAIVTGKEIEGELVSFAEGLHLAWFHISALALPAYRKTAAPVNWQALRLKLDLQLGYTMLPADELSQLKPGDIVLMQNSRGVARIGQNEICTLRLEEEGMYIEQSEDNTNQSDEQSEELFLTAGFTLDGVQVKVDFMVGEEIMTLQQLQQLTAGDVLSLRKDHQGTRQVYLKVQNQRVAEGELVLLDGQLAVEITQVQGAPASE